MEASDPCKLMDTTCFKVGAHQHLRVARGQETQLLLSGGLLHGGPCDGELSALTQARAPEPTGYVRTAWASLTAAPGGDSFPSWSLRFLSVIWGSRIPTCLWGVGEIEMR